MKSAVEMLKEMSEDQKGNARVALVAVLAGEPLPLSHGEAKELEAIGLLTDVTEPSRRGRAAGRYKCGFSEQLFDVVEIMRLRWKLERTAG